MKIWIFLPPNCFRHPYIGRFWCLLPHLPNRSVKVLFLTSFPKFKFCIFLDLIYCVLDFQSSVWGKITFINLRLWLAISTLWKELSAQYSSSKILKMLQQGVKSREWWEGSSDWTLKIKPFFHRIKKIWKNAKYKFGKGSNKQNFKCHIR